MSTATTTSHDTGQQTSPRGRQRDAQQPVDTIKSEAQQRLGTLFNQADYPSTLDGLFDMEWSVVPIEPPQYLVALNPEVFRQEQARVCERFESAVELAEQAFVTEPQQLMAHLAERLTGLHDGQSKVFEDSAVENLRDFEQIRAAVGDLLVDRPRRNILGGGQTGAGV